MEYLNTPAKLPNSAHFAAIVFDTVWIPGDQRSKSAPGHGYPEHSEQTIKYIVFKDADEMEAWARTKEHPAYGPPEKNYRLIRAEGLTVQVKISVKVGRRLVAR